MCFASCLVSPSGRAPPPVSVADWREASSGSTKIISGNDRLMHYTLRPVRAHLRHASSTPCTTPRCLFAFFSFLFVSEWATSIQRDTLASHIGHYSRLAYFAVVENENIKRLRYRFLNVSKDTRNL